MALKKLSHSGSLAGLVQGPEDHLSARILEPGSKAQDKGDTRNQIILYSTDYIPYTIL